MLLGIIIEKNVKIIERLSQIKVLVSMLPSGTSCDVRHHVLQISSCTCIGHTGIFHYALILSAGEALQGEFQCCFSIQYAMPLTSLKRILIFLQFDTNTMKISGEWTAIWTSLLHKTKLDRIQYKYKASVGCLHLQNDLICTGLEKPPLQCASDLSYVAS